MAVSQLPAAGTALYTMRFLLRTPVYRLPEGDCLMERTDASAPRRRFRRVVKWVGILAGAVLVLMGLAVAVVVVSEWTYIDRMRHHPADPITNVAWYVPKEKVPGVGSVSLPVAPPEATTIDPAALEDAARLADAKNSSALLIVHDDRIVMERHWRGHSPGDWTNSASMAKTITALLIGIARDEGQLDGHAKQRVYVAPSQRLVVVRVGENARAWDESALVNAVLRGLTTSAAGP